MGAVATQVVESDDVIAGGDDVVANVDDKVIDKTGEELPIREQIAQNYQKRQEEELGIVREEEPAEKPVEPEMVEVKVNGQTRQVDAGKIEEAGGIDIYQKRLAAEDGLKTLSNGRKELAQSQQDFQKKQDEFYQWQEEEKKKLQTQSVAPSIQDGHEVSSDLPVGDQNKELAKEYREALYNGENDKADEILTRMATVIKAQPQGATQPVVDPEEIKRDATDLAVKQIEQNQLEKDIDQAKTAFDEKYSDIKSDPALFDMADQKTIGIHNEHPDWTPQQVIEESGRQVREWVDNVRGQSASGKTTQSKLEAKRNLQSPKAGTGRSTSPPEPKQETNSEYIQKLRKSRGLG